MIKDYEYRYYMDDNKLMRFHVEQDDFWENPRDFFEYFPKMYMSNREYTCTDKKIKEIESNDDAIRMMIDDANIDVVSAVCEGKVPDMTIKYDETTEDYELWIDDYIEEESMYKEWLDDAIKDNLTLTDLMNICENLIVIPLDFTYEGGIRKAYDENNSDGFIWTTIDDMKSETCYSFETDNEWKEEGYKLLESEIEEENSWAIGDVFWFETEVCNDVINADDERCWDESESVGGYIVDGYKAYDYIYENEIGVTPYHDSIDGLFDWPEFKISFDDYYNALNEAEALDDMDTIRETLKDKIDWSEKSLADAMSEIKKQLDITTDALNTIIGNIRLHMNEANSDGLITLIAGASSEYQKAYEKYQDMEYRLTELKALA